MQPLSNTTAAIIIIAAILIAGVTVYVQVHQHEDTPGEPIHRDSAPETGSSAPAGYHYRRDYTRKDGTFVPGGYQHNPTRKH